MKWGQMSISALIRRVSNRTDGSQKSSLRPDIQGLRAFAVLVVIADHLFHWPSGGFVGVDIFFVISGFVITLSLMREHSRSGTISIKGFYFRRVKRIMPAAALTLAVTVVTSYVVFGTARFLSVLWDAAIASAFFANWRFAATGTDYFQADGPVSPLQHFWSLAVEEQFYLVWPFVVVGIFILATRARRDRQARILACAAVVIITVASLAWAFWETTQSPTLAYFSTFSRVWELGIGAILAIIAPVFSRLRGSLRPVLAWVGASGMVAALFLTDGTSSFPAPFALLPVLSAALFIAAGTGASQFPTLQPFTNGVSNYIGNASYSLYLWHFPIIVLGAAVYPDPNLTYYLVTLAGIIFVSFSAFELWEKPIHKSGWLEGKKGWLRQSSVSEGYKNKGLGFLAILTAAAVAVTFQPAQLPETATAAPVPVETPAAAVASPEEVALRALSTEIAGSARLSAFPTSEPSVELPDLWKPEQMQAGANCLNPRDMRDTTACTYGSGDKLAMVVGDSVAISWMPAIISALGPQGYRVHGVGISDCPFADVEIAIQDNPAGSKVCNESKEEIQFQIAELSPDLVITSDFEYNIIRLASKASGDAAIAEWSSGLARSVEQAKQSGAAVTILAPNPAGASPLKCITGVSAPPDCIEPIAGSWNQKSTAEKSAAAATGVRYVDSRKWFCTSSGVCPLIVGDDLTRWDVVHLSRQYGAKIGPLMTLELVS